MLLSFFCVPTRKCEIRVFSTTCSNQYRYMCVLSLFGCSVLWLWLWLGKRCIENWHEWTQCECLCVHKFMQHNDWDNVHMVLYLLVNVTWKRKCASIGQTLRTFHVIGMFVSERSHCPYQKQKNCTFKTQLRTTWVKKLETKKQFLRTQNMLTGSRSRNLDLWWRKWWQTHIKKHRGSCLSCACWNKLLVKNSCVLFLSNIH